MRPHRTRYTLGIIGLHVVILTMVCIPDPQRLGQEGRGIVESKYMELGQLASIHPFIHPSDHPEGQGNVY